MWNTSLKYQKMHQVSSFLAIIVKDEIDALVNTLRNPASKVDKRIIMMSVAYFIMIEL
jgi:hypothetical protein